MKIVKIIYCTQCGWLPRTTWMAQELLNTFTPKIDELILVPSTGGIFEVYVNEKLVWSRLQQNGFPQIKELKQLVRDEIAPGMDLGHSNS